MDMLRITLFDKLRLHWNGRPLQGPEAGKAQELLCYLLLYRTHPHKREVLVDVLWGAQQSEQAKKYLRKALWQLQSTLQASTRSDAVPMLLVEHQWVSINPNASFWLDVDVFEKARAEVQGMRGRELDEAAARTLKDAVQLYTADLLESWYQEWCLCERQRLQDMYHTMLDKLMDYCEAHLDYETGLLYGTRILRLDPAQERTHRRLMRLHYLGGDRTAALRQYQLCERALRENLNVKPAQRTVALYEQIRADQLEHLAPTPPDEGASKTVPQPAEIVADLKHYGTILADLQRRIYMNIQALEDLLGSQH